MSRKTFDIVKSELSDDLDTVQGNSGLLDIVMGLLRGRKGVLAHELLQNALDAGSEEVRYYFDSKRNEMIFEHDGDNPLDAAAVKGLCSWGRSTKGLDSVGFMGIGFKSFLVYFNSVDITGFGWSFTISPGKTGPVVNYSETLKPEWNGSLSPPSNGFTTRFHFYDVVDQDSAAIDEIHEGTETIAKPSVLALLASRGLRKIWRQVPGNKYQEEAVIKKMKGGYYLVQDFDGEEDHRFRIYGTEVLIEDEASLTDFVRSRRAVLDNNNITFEQLCSKGLKREVNIVTGSDKKGNPVPVRLDEDERFHSGLPVGIEFPFNFGIDSDWLVTPARDKIEGDSYTSKLLLAIPDILADYLNSLDPKLTPKERKRALSVVGCEVDHLSYLKPPLNFINKAEEDEKIFFDVLADKIGNIPFILCTDGELRSPQDTAYFEFPEQTKKPEDIFSTPIADPEAISPITKQLLQNHRVGHLGTPSIEDINLEALRAEWNPKKPDEFFDIDSKWIGRAYFRVGKGILGEIIRQCGIGYGTDKRDKWRNLRIIPTAEGDWMSLLDPPVIGDLPDATGPEEDFHTALEEKKAESENPLRIAHPQFKKSRQLMLLIENQGKYAENRPNLPSMEKFLRSMKIKGISIPKLVDDLIEEEELHDSVFYYCAKRKLTELTHARNSEGKLVPINEVFITKYTRVDLELPTDSALHEGYEELIGGLFESKAAMRNWLVKAGIRAIMVEKLRWEGGISAFIEPDFWVNLVKNVPFNKSNKSFSKFRDNVIDFTNGKINYGQIDEVRLYDDRWSFDLEQISKPSRAKYLCDPDRRLRNSISGSLQYHYAGWYAYGYPRQTTEYWDWEIHPKSTWLKDLQRLEWVLDREGNIWKPSEVLTEEDDSIPEAPIANITSEYAELLKANGVKFGAEVEGPNPEELLDSAKKKIISPSTIIAAARALRNSGYSEKLVREKLLDVLVKSTRRNVPLSLCFRKRESQPDYDLGGWLVEAGDLDHGLIESLEQAGHKIPNGISPSIAKEVIRKISEAATDPSFEALRQAYEILALSSPGKLDGEVIYTNQDKWSGADILALHHGLGSTEKALSRIDIVLAVRGQFPADPSIASTVFDWFGIGDFNEQVQIIGHGEYFSEITKLLSIRGREGIVAWKHGSSMKIEVEGHGALDVPAYFDGANLHLSGDPRNWYLDVTELLDGGESPTRKIMLNEVILWSDIKEDFESRLAQYCEKYEIMIPDADPEEPDPLSTDTEATEIDVDTTSTDKPASTKKKPQDEAKAIESLDEKFETIEEAVSELKETREALDEVSKKLEKEQERSRASAEPNASEGKEFGNDRNSRKIVLDWEKKRGRGETKPYPDNNPGFDVETIGDDGTIRRIEIKGSIHEKTEGTLSMRQVRDALDNALENRGNNIQYWLYIVENIESEPSKHRVKAIDWTEYKVGFVFEKDRYKHRDD